VQSLERAGRFDEALGESEALLGAPEGRALSSDIHWLRARIYDARSDCGSAVSELVSLVGEAGERGDEAEMRRAVCLERLGRKSEARAAYEHYLERAEPRRVNEARQKVEELRP
jgi:Flp pilus assembly protein TadD